MYRKHGAERIFEITSVSRTLYNDLYTIRHLLFGSKTSYGVNMTMSSNTYKQHSTSAQRVCCSCPTTQISREINERNQNCERTRTDLHYAYPGILSLRKSHRYPLTVPDLHDGDLKALIVILATTPPPSDIFPYFIPGIGDEIERNIRKLSSELRKRSSIFSLYSPVTPAATLCSTHKGLNQYVISHIIRLIKREVGEHLELIIRWHYPDPLHPDVSGVIRSLRSLQGLWWDLIANPNAPDEAVKPQQNKCEACMISRIILDSKFLLDLRAALISRTRERCSHRPLPKLLRIVETTLTSQHGISPQHFDANSLQLSARLKEARKYATKYKRSHSRKCNREDCMPRFHRNTVPLTVPPINQSHVFDPERRPSSQSVMSYMLEKRHPRFEVLVGSPGKNVDKQEQLVLEILSLYESCASRRTKAGVASDSQIQYSTPQPFSKVNENESTLVASGNSDSDWEDDWDQSSISANSGNHNLRMLIDYIDDLLADNEDLVELSPGTRESRRKITIVSPIKSYHAVVEDWSGAEIVEDRSVAETEHGQGGLNPDDIVGQRKNSDITTWSRFMEESNEGEWI